MGSYLEFFILEIYLFSIFLHIQSFIYIIMESRIFVYTSAYSVVQIVTLAIENSFVGSCMSFFIPNHCGFLFCCRRHSAHHYFLSLQDAPGPYCIFPDPSLELSISNDLQFLWKVVLKTKTWILGVHGATRVLLLLTPLLGGVRKYESMLLHVYTHTYKYYEYEIICILVN